MKTIYGHGTQYQKSEWYEIWNGRPEIGRTNLFALRDIKQHATTRRHYANVYAMSSLVSYEPYVNNCIDIFTSRLQMCGKSGETIDLSKWFQYYAFDVIGEITVCFTNVESPMCVWKQASAVMGPRQTLTSTF